MIRCSNPRCACGGAPRVVVVDGTSYTAHHLRDRWSVDGSSWSRIYEVDGLGVVSASPCRQLDTGRPLMLDVRPRRN